MPKTYIHTKQERSLPFIMSLCINQILATMTSYFKKNEETTIRSDGDSDYRYAYGVEVCPPQNYHTSSNNQVMKFGSRF